MSLPRPSQFLPRCLALAAALALWLGMAAPASADEPDWTWQPLNSLEPYDLSIAQAALFPLMGEDPTLWADWMDPRVVLIPVRGGNIMILREPFRQGCGDWGYMIFSPYRTDGTRARLGEMFCADGLEVVPPRFQNWPDLVLRNVGSPTSTTEPADHPWQVSDQRLHWSGEDWMIQTPKKAR